jgi:hypothetical protein
MNNTIIPTFSIYADGKKVPTIEHCFMERSLLSIKNPPATMRAKNGKNYQCVYDKFYLSKTMIEKDVIEIIISFQSHSYGEFAVIRTANSEERFVSPRSTKNAPIINNEITGIEVSDFGPLSSLSEEYHDNLK